MPSLGALYALVAAVGFIAGAAICWLAFRAGIQLTLRLMQRARDDFSDPFADEQVPEIQQEVTE